MIGICDCDGPGTVCCSVPENTKNRDLLAGEITVRRVSDYDGACVCSATDRGRRSGCNLHILTRRGRVSYQSHGRLLGARKSCRTVRTKIILQKVVSVCPAYTLVRMEYAYAWRNNRGSTAAARYSERHCRCDQR